MQISITFRRNPEQPVVNPASLIERLKQWHLRSKAGATVGRVEHHILNDIGLSALQVQEEILQPLSRDE